MSELYTLPVASIPQYNTHQIHHNITIIIFNIRNVIIKNCDNRNDVKDNLVLIMKEIYVHIVMHGYRPLINSAQLLQSYVDTARNRRMAQHQQHDG